MATQFPVTLEGWFYTAGGQGKHFLCLANSTDSTNVLMLGLNVTSTANQVVAFAENTSANQNQAVSASIPINAWHYCTAVFSTKSVNSAYLDGVNKASHTTPAQPTGINVTQLSGRAGDFSFGIGGQCAHVGGFTRGLADIEVAYRGGGGNIRYLGFARYWRCLATETTTIVDQAGVENLTVTGLTAGTTDPILATYWTAAAQGNLSLTQGTPIASITFSSKYDLMNAAVDYTVTLNQIGTAGTATSASGAATSATNVLTVNDPTNIAAGKYVKIGSNAFNLVLFVSGSSVLLATSQTWNNADAVTPYPVNALAVNGLAITAGVFAGTPGAPAVGTYANCLFRAANNTTATLIADSAPFSIAVASSGAAPSFSAGPTETSATTDGYAFSATSNQTATWYSVAMLRGSTAPIAAQVKTGSPTGFVSRFSTALTATISGALTFTGLVNPVYDVYHVVDNGSGTSAVVPFVGLMKTPPAGKQYVTAAVNAITAITRANPVQVTSTTHGYVTGYWVEHFGIGAMTQMNGVFGTITVVDANNYTVDGVDSTAFTPYTSGGTSSWGQSVDYNASAVVVTGDIRVVDLVTNEDGLSITMFPNGAISFNFGAVTARQTYAVDIYDISAQGFMGVATDYQQDVPPIAPQANGILPGIFLAANQTTINTPLATLATDVQLDPLTVSASGLPAGLSISSGNIVGSTGGNSIVPIVVTWQNLSGDQSIASMNLVIGQITPPDIRGLTQGPIQTLLQNFYLSATFGSQNDPAPSGQAIAQNPPFGTPVNANSVINVTLSTGIVVAVNITVPDVSSTPTDQATATALLTAAGFVPIVPQAWTGVQKIFQNPTAGSQLLSGSLVYLLLIGGSARPPRPRKMKLRKKAKGVRAAAPVQKYVLRRPMKRK